MDCHPEFISGSIGGTRVKVKVKDSEINSE